MRLAAGTVVATVECPDCGNSAAIKANKNGSLYLVCTAIIDPATRDRCYCRKAWGRAASKRMIEELSASIAPPQPTTTTKDETHVQIETDPIATVASGPIGQQQPEPYQQPVAEPAPSGNGPAKRGGLFSAWS